jgi:ornithine cyclodeaminase/alanine dehydrogenase-like protein (mu-crystallin family)
MTRILTRSEVAALLEPAESLPALRAAFQAYSLNRAIPAQRARSPLPGEAPASVALLFPGLVPGIPAYTVKVHAKFPQQQPAIKGVLHLHDLETGQLLAIMDSTYLTAVRTGLAGAIAADTLARAEAGRVAIIGAGVQGEMQLRCLALVRTLRQVRVFDTLPGQAEDYARRMEDAVASPILPASTLAKAVQDADIIVTATWSRAPFLFADMLQPGAHITTLGPDEPGKCEVDADVIQAGLFVCDDRELAAKIGAIAGAGLGDEAIHAELGEILAGQRPGRANAEQITIYGGVGLAFQDVVAAWQVYQKALQQQVGQEINFLS